MSFLTRTTRSLTRIPTPATARLVVTRCMSDRSGNEGAHMSGNDPHVLETEKHKSLKDKQWNEKLASSAEASVKADRDHGNKHDDIQKLQRESAEKMQGDKAGHVSGSGKGSSRK
ncbi:hypothetical protein HK104_003727 [Borealophlyctis nickersoniae]|nr:hypothetical protein HK104_003727 [Borealophlyctis nickersoniae]